MLRKSKNFLLQPELLKLKAFLLTCGGWKKNKNQTMRKAGKRRQEMGIKNQNHNLKNISLFFCLFAYQYATADTGSCSEPSIYLQSMLNYLNINVDVFTDLFYTTGSDYSLNLLSSVVGSMGDVQCLSGQSAYAQMTKNLIDIFTTGMFSIALILFSYTSLMGTIYTASEGEVMGRKMQTYFVFFRSMTAMLLYMPMGNGYSILQSMVTNIVIVSVMLANAAWYLTSTLIVTTLQGPLGLQILTTAGEQFSLESFVNDTQSNITSFTNQQTETYLVAEDSKVSNLTSTAYILGQFTQTLCIYDCYYTNAPNADSYISQVNNAYADITNKINTTWIDDSNVFSINTSEINASCACGNIGFTVEDGYGNNALSQIKSSLNTLNTLAQSVYMEYVAQVQAGNVNPIATITESSSQINSIANSLSDSVKAMVSEEIQSYIVSTGVQSVSSGSDSSDSSTWITKLVDGGWAMAANNYYHVTTELFAAMNDATSSTTDYSTYLYMTPQADSTGALSNTSGFCNGIETDETASMCGYSIKLSSQISDILSTTTTTESDATETTPSSMSECAEDITKCSNLSDKVMQYENGNAIAKDFVKRFYSGWSSQISNIDSVKQFAEIEGMNRICNVPFVSSSLNECKSDATFMSPDEAQYTYIAAFTGAVVGLSVVPRVLAPVFFSPMVFLTGSAMYNDFDDAMTIWTNPNKMYPKPLALGVQSFTYFTVKAWYDVFAQEQGYLFTFPVQTISSFGFRVLFNTVAFVLNVGTATFASSISMTLDMFVRQVLIDITTSVVKWYAKVPYNYGWWWLSVLYNPVGVYLQYTDMILDLDLPLPLPVPIPIPIVFIVIFLNYLIGPILIAVGFISNMMSILLTLINIFNPADMILQIQSFIISKWNPLYFAISVPLISFATLFAFFLPLYPIVVYTLAVITWLTQYIETLMAMPIILLGMANPEGHSPLLGKAEKSIMLLTLLFIRPITTVMGFIFGNIMACVSTYFFYQTMIPLLNLQIGQWALGYSTLFSSSATVLSTAAQDNTIQAVMVMLALIMFTMVYYYLLLFAFSLIYKLPNGISTWVGMRPDNTQEEEIVQNLSSEINSLTGSLVNANNQISESKGNMGAAGGGLDFNKKYNQGKHSKDKQLEQGANRRNARGDQIT